MNRPRVALSLVLLVCLGAASLTAQGLLAKEGAPLSGAQPENRPQYSGVASWYGAEFQGRITSSGEAYDREALTAAHRSLPFGTLLLVRSLDSGASVVVRVNDRGPSAPGRDLALSEAAARILGMLMTGTARVSYREIAPEEAAIFGSPRPHAAATPGLDSPPTAPAFCRVQVASFRDARNAETTLARLKLSGLEAIIESYGANRRVVFPAVPAAKVEALAERLRSLGYLDLIITWY